MRDKDKQLEEIASDICPFYKDCGSCERCNKELDTDGELCYFMHRAMHIVRCGYRKQTEGEWVSVDDRLPDKNTMVLGFIHNVYADGSCWDNMLVMELNSAGYFVPFNCATIKDNRVTHWMPLPEPPKMKGCESDA